MHIEQVRSQKCVLAVILQVFVGKIFLNLNSSGVCREKIFLNLFLDMSGKFFYFFSLSSPSPPPHSPTDFWGKNKGPQLKFCPGPPNFSVRPCKYYAPFYWNHVHFCQFSRVLAFVFILFDFSNFVSLVIKQTALISTYFATLEFNFTSARKYTTSTLLTDSVDPYGEIEREKLFCYSCKSTFLRMTSTYST